ncbi:F-box protein [Tanacetum coccineum]
MWSAAGRWWKVAKGGRRRLMAASTNALTEADKRAKAAVVAGGTNTLAVNQENESQKEEKFKIDLMAPLPQQRTPPERDNGNSGFPDHKAQEISKNVKDKEDEKIWTSAEPQNMKEAVKWLYQASEAGYVRQQYQLAFCLHRAIGTDQNMKEAVRWYLRAAEGGHVHAMYEVAMCYASGRGIAQDCQQSRKWMKLSADDGYKKAQFEHGRTLFLVMSDSIKKHLRSFSRQLNLKAVLTPLTIGAVLKAQTKKQIFMEECVKTRAEHHQRAIMKLRDIIKPVGRGALAEAALAKTQNIF